MASEIEISIQGVPDSLGGVFTVPDDMDSRAQTMFYTIADRMREEGKYLHMSTVQCLLMERIASTYVKLRHLESLDDVSQVKLMQYYAEQWLKCTVEFNKVISRTLTQEARNAYMVRVNDVIMQALESVEDQKMRMQMANLFVRAVEAAGL